MFERTRSATLVIWLTASIIAALSCSLYFDAAHLGEEYLPVGNDSFYHARRIVDTVLDPGSFYQFDAKIHAPEGSLLVWPWGYDYLIAQVVRLGMAAGLSADPMAIVIWIPVAAVFVSLGLLVLVARRLDLSTWPVALAAGCMALSPTTQFLHGVGLIDHHYAELIFILAALAAGLKWLREPDNVRSAATLAAVFGIAPAIHNGLFILQLPLLITLFARWLQGIHAPRKSTAIFAAVLLSTTTAVLIPSPAFRAAQFEFYILSWFHLYIAFATALAAVLFSTVKRSPKMLAVLAICGVALIVPIISQIQTAHAFVTGTFKWLETIVEMKSPLVAALTPGGARSMSSIYSLSIWLAPLTFLLCLVQCWRERSRERLLFWISSAAGLALLSAQVRMHYFGDFALYLPWLVLIDDYAKARALPAKKIFLAASAALLLLYAPALRHLVMPVAKAKDFTFEETRPMYSVLQRACAQDPGIVLADNNAGHYIRYYTDCSVIANNFLLTAQHFAKMDEAAKLFTMRPQDLIAAAPQVKYVLVRPIDIRRADDPAQGYRYWFAFPDALLAHELLIAPPDRAPLQYELLDEVRLPAADNIPYARLYRIRRPPASSSNEGTK